jgi:hypothetical protein
LFYCNQKSLGYITKKGYVAEGRNNFVVPPWLSLHVAMQALMNRPSTVATMVTEFCRQVLLSVQTDFFLPLAGDFPWMGQVDAFIKLYNLNSLQ